MKRRRWITLAIMLGFAVFCLLTFRSSLTPYVTFAQARGMNGSVQVRGTLVPGTLAARAETQGLTFLLRDESGEEMAVVYRGVRPEGLEEASGLVAAGKYREGQFAADQLLVKCPSKYQGSVKK